MRKLLCGIGAIVVIVVGAVAIYAALSAVMEINKAVVQALFDIDQDIGIATMWKMPGPSEYGVPYVPATGWTRVALGAWWMLGDFFALLIAGVVYSLWRALYNRCTAYWGAA